MRGEVFTLLIICRSTNLVFSERKIVYVGAKKSSSRYINNKFTLNLKIASLVYAL